MSEQAFTINKGIAALADQVQDCENACCRTKSWLQAFELSKGMYASTTHSSSKLMTRQQGKVDGPQSVCGFLHTAQENKSTLGVVLLGLLGAWAGQTPRAAEEHAPVLTLGAAGAAL